VSSISVEKVLKDLKFTTDTLLSAIVDRVTEILRVHGYES